MNTSAARPPDLPAWLAYLETLHPKSIAMGLDRVRAVAERLNVRIDVPVITVTGMRLRRGSRPVLAFIFASAKC